jgi:hypothetical protein
MNISKYNKAEILAALYNNSRPLGMGILHFDAKPMTTEEAELILKETQYFDYLKGRVMKIDLSGDELATHLYNRDNGTNAAEEVISQLQQITTA